MDPNKSVQGLLNERSAAERTHRDHGMAMEAAIRMQKQREDAEAIQAQIGAANIQAHEAWTAHQAQWNTAQDQWNTQQQVPRGHPRSNISASRRMKPPPPIPPGRSRRSVPRALPWKAPPPHVCQGIVAQQQEEFRRYQLQQLQQQQLQQHAVPKKAPPHCRHQR